MPLSVSAKGKFASLAPESLEAKELLDNYISAPAPLEEVETEIAGESAPDNLDHID